MTDWSEASGTMRGSHGRGQLKARTPLTSRKTQLEYQSAVGRTKSDSQGGARRPQSRIVDGTPIREHRSCSILRALVRVGCTAGDVQPRHRTTACRHRPQLLKLAGRSWSWSGTAPESRSSSPLPPPITRITHGSQSTLSVLRLTRTRQFPQASSCGIRRNIPRALRGTNDGTNRRASGGPFTLAGRSSR